MKEVEAVISMNARVEVIGKRAKLEIIAIANVITIAIALKICLQSKNFSE